MTFSPQQEQAIRSVKDWLAAPSGRPFFYLAGYAGTGKTTLAKTLAGELAKVSFAAFTGKAALVLKGKGCGDAKTIHSLIYSYDPETYEFHLNRDSEASLADLIVIDEVSMVGEDLGRDLLSFGRPILVLGDPAQLPPVDGEGFFTRGEPDFMMTEVHRQAADNPIIAMSMTVREGGRLSPGAYGESLVLARGERPGQKMVLGADQVLVGKNATRRTHNAKIRKLLGFEGPYFERGDRIVCLKNNKDRGLLNGSLWNVEDIEFQDADETEMTIRALDAGMRKKPLDVKAKHAWLTGGERDLPPDRDRQYDAFDFGYALTVHKAQGSQWDNVLIFDESFIFREDRARWLYTAITRAAERVTIVAG